MMTSISVYVRRGQHRLYKLTLEPRLRLTGRALGYGLLGMGYSGAGLLGISQPLALGPILSRGGWPAVVTALGAALGYRLFWGGTQELVWAGAAGVLALVLGERPVTDRVPQLMVSLAMLLVSATGLVFQLVWGTGVAVPLYLLRVGLGMGATWLFDSLRRRQDPLLKWVAGALGMLSLGRLPPVGLLALGMVGAVGPFPAGCLSGLALDLTAPGAVSWTAVATLSYYLRLIPLGHRAWQALAPALAYGLLALLTGGWEPQAPMLLALGGGLGVLLPLGRRDPLPRGSTGAAQVRLELAAGVMEQAGSLLAEVTEGEIDALALLRRTGERACGGCPNRRECGQVGVMGALPAELLHRAVLIPGDLGVECAKTGRVLTELHRTQEQLRAMKASRERQWEYRQAVIQQYRFLSAYLTEVGNQLSRDTRSPQARFRPRVQVYANRRQGENGDRCLWFAGPQCRYYVLLCDGMGTGPAAMAEGKTGARLLRQLLMAGFPAEHALESLNSLTALRQQAGAFTMDLAELHLDTGRGRLFKWGAAPSYLIGPGGTRQLGGGTPPPGIRVTQDAPGSRNLGLNRGQTLVMASDGIRPGEELWHCSAPEALARSLVESSAGPRRDDATVVIVTLTPAF